MVRFQNRQPQPQILHGVAVEFIRPTRTDDISTILETRVVDGQAPQDRLEVDAQYRQKQPFTPLDTTNLRLQSQFKEGVQELYDKLGDPQKNMVDMVATHYSIEDTNLSLMQQHHNNQLELSVSEVMKQQEKSRQLDEQAAAAARRAANMEAQLFNTFRTTQTAKLEAQALAHLATEVRNQCSDLETDIITKRRVEFRVDEERQAKKARTFRSFEDLPFYAEAKAFVVSGLIKTGNGASPRFWTDTRGRSHLPPQCGTPWYPGGTGWYHGGTAWYPCGTAWYPGGTAWYHGGTAWYPCGTAWYPGGTGWYHGGTAWYPCGTAWVLGLSAKNIFYQVSMKSCEGTELSDSDHEPSARLATADETLEVQIDKAKKSRKKGVEAHKQTGKAVQKLGVEAKKTQAAASKREREIERLTKKNDHLEKLAKISDLEYAERERAELLKRNNREKTPAQANAPKPTVQDGDLHAKLTRLEELIMARQSEAAPVAPKKRAKKAPPRQQAPPDSSDDSEDEPPRQKAVRRSAKAALKQVGGAQEEMINKRAHLVGNKHKAKAMELDQERRFADLGSQLFPGRY